MILYLCNLLQVLLNHQTVTQHQVIKCDVAALLEVRYMLYESDYSSSSQVENHSISELRSKVMILRCNADELEKKMALILQELDKYSTEVKVLLSNAFEPQ